MSDLGASEIVNTEGIEVQIATGLSERIELGDYVSIIPGLSFSGFYRVDQIEPLQISNHDLKINLSPVFVAEVYKKVSRDVE